MSAQTDLAFTAKASEELTFLSRQRLERQKYRALALTLFVVPFAFVWLFFQTDRGPGGQAGSALFSSLVYLLTSLIGAYWCFCSAYRARRGPLVLGQRHFLVWLLLGLGLLLPGLGTIYPILYQLLVHALPAQLSYTDITLTLSHGLILAALLLMPVSARDTRPSIHMLIDALITMLCLFGVNWSLLLNPVLNLSRSGELLSTLVSISYPCWDILLLLAFLLFIHQRASTTLRPSLLIYALGAFALFWADSLYARVSSYGHYHPGAAAIEPFWFLSALVFGIASLYQYSALANQAYGEKNWFGQTTSKLAAAHRANLPFERRFLLLQSFMIYLPVTLLLSITLYSQFTTDSALIHSLDILCSLVLFLLVTHYVLATYENARLMHEEEQKSADAEMLRRSTASLSSVLEMDLLQNHIVTIGAHELGFEAAALVLGEEYGRPPDEQSSLVARAASKRKHSLASWRIIGEKIPLCLALLQEMEILWADAPPHVSTPLHQWHQEQALLATLFVPLVFQGRSHGCLAFSLRISRNFTPREYYLARAFAAEAANAIEHAHLYELARENALFSQAMSNVAARLNSVVAVGMGMGSEIHHLICSEGANALRADLAILYVHHPDGQFVPQAAIAIDPEPQTFAQEWPPIVPDDYFALQSHSSQPTLFHMNRGVLPPPQIDPPKTPVPGSPFESSAFQAEAGPVTPTYLPPEAVRTVRLRPISLHAMTTRPIPPRRSGHLASLPQPFSALLETLQRRHTSTTLLAPLLVHRVPMGMLVLARTHRPGGEKRDFTPADLVPAQDFAGQAAIAFTNARLYEQLHSAHRRLQELDQLKDQFMVTASHELRTPLTAVQGYLDLLEHYRSSLPDEQQQEFLEKASRGCDELVLLLNNVMDASRLEIEAGIHNTHLERVSLREVVDSVVDLILLQAKQEQREVRVKISSHLQVQADPSRLRQVVRNLSANALKYSPPGTPLTFSARPIFGQNASVILGVTDRGKGIHPGDQGKIFQRFVRLERDLNSTVRGSGLGLYISRRLVEAMNGRIWVESSGEAGAGSTFCVQLPMA